MQTKVVKFGGSSLADAQHFKQVADIIHADPSRRYVVPSAPGKRFKNDEKVTDIRATYDAEALRAGVMLRRGKKSYKKVVLK